MTPMNRSEAMAKCVVEDVLDGVTARYRHHQEALPDFDLLLGSSEFGVLEVVMATSPMHQEIHAVFRDDRKGGPFVSTELCVRDWRIRRGRPDILAAEGRWNSRFRQDTVSGRLLSTNEVGTRFIVSQYFQPDPEAVDDR